MARKVYSYQPFNETPDVALGILLPFNKDAGGSREAGLNYASASGGGKGVFLSSYTTEEQSISNLKNLLLTSKGERIFRPNFGTNIQNILFENNTIEVEEELEETLRADIEFWLPYIIINNLDIIRDVDNYSFFIKLQFSVSRNRCESRNYYLC
jgi:phage baseplate assembly protein W